MQWATLLKIIWNCWPVYFHNVTFQGKCTAHETFVFVQCFAEGAHGTFAATCSPRQSQNPPISCHSHHLHNHLILVYSSQSKLNYQLPATPNLSDNMLPFVLERQEAPPCSRFQFSTAAASGPHFAMCQVSPSLNTSLYIGRTSGHVDVLLTLWWRMRAYVDPTCQSDATLSWWLTWGEEQPPPPPPKKKKTAESFIHVRQKLNSNMLPTCNRQIICVINDSLFPFWRLDNEMRKLTSSGWYRKALHERFGNLCKLQWIWHSFAVKVLHEKIEDRKITLDDLAFSADQLPIANQFCFTSQTMELTYNSASLIFKRKKFTICKSETQLRSCEGCDIISLEKKVSWRRSIDAWFVIVLNKEERKVKKDVFDLTKTYTMRACKSDRIARDVHKGHESNKNVSLESIDLVHQNKLQETAKFAVWLGEMTCQIQP